MKKLIYLFMLALPCLMMGACGNEIVRKVQQTKDGGLSDGFLYYKITSNTSESREVMVSRCKGGIHDVEIPTAVEFNGEKFHVTSIGSKAFMNSNYPDSSSLTSITIPTSITSIGEGAFWGCSGLTSITIPNSVTSIGEGAFCGCSGLTSITIPNSVTSIGEGAFSDCYGLTSITIPSGVTSIGEGAFFGCYVYSFNASESLEAEKNNYWGAYVCDSQGLVIKDNVVIACAKRETSVTIPNSVTIIGDKAFNDCSGLTSITIPNSITSIGESAFWGCSGLTSITIPNSVTSIGEGAFSDCSGLASIIVESGNTKYDSRENCNAIIETASNTLIQSCKNSVIPNSVTSSADMDIDIVICDVL